MTEPAPTESTNTFPEVPLFDRGNGYKTGTELLLVRHGESMRNIYSNLVSYDPNLTALGWAQALAAGEWLAEHMPVDVVITSPLRRAHSTALAIATAQGKQPVVISGLEEFSHFFYDEMPHHHPTQPWWGRSDWSPTFEQAPNFVAFRDRVHTALSDILETYGGQRVCVVSHGGTMSVLTAAMTGSSHLSVWNENTGMSLFIWPEWRRWLIHYINRTEHLLGLNLSDYPRVTEAILSADGSWRLPDSPMEDWEKMRPHPQLSFLSNRLRRSDRILFIHPPDPITPVRVALRSRQAVILSDNLLTLEAGELRRALLNANHIRFQYLFHPLPYADGHFDFVVLPASMEINDETRRVLAATGQILTYVPDDGTA